MRLIIAGLRKIVVRFRMLRNMQNDLFCQFEAHTIAKEMWDAPRAISSGTSAIRLR